MRNKREVSIGDVMIGGNNRVAIQSMTNTNTCDVKATIEQIARLTDAGCEIVRVAVPNMQAAYAIKEIKSAIKIPLVVDIHFDYKLALECIKNGADKVRINPGNIGTRENTKAVVDAAKANGVPIRIGVNGGSLEKSILDKYGHVCSEALVESALSHIAILDELNFFDTVVSIKVSDVPTTIKAYRQLDKITNLPLHIGLTEAGTLKSGIIKSATGLGALLSDGIGDTMRVSLTADPVEEIFAAKEILSVFDKSVKPVNFISCPTCGRTQIDLIKIANEVEAKLVNCKKNITVAVMGCAVNGPGEAREADIGIAGGNGVGIIFKKGEIIKKVPENELVDALITEIGGLQI